MKITDTTTENADFIVPNKKTTPGGPSVSGDASASANGENPSAPTTIDYSSMLNPFDTAIAEAERKVENGRVYDAENEKVRIKWIRALAYTINVRRQVAADRDLEELAERIERLEAEGVGDRI